MLRNRLHLICIFGILNMLIATTPFLRAEPFQDDEETSRNRIDIESILIELDQLKKEVNALRDEIEIRRKLQITEEEKAKEEEEILSATGREYTLLKSGTVGMEYTVSYSYYSYFALLSTDSDELSGGNGSGASGDESSQIYDLIRYMKYFGNHVMDHSVFIEYAYLDNLTLNANLPFTFRYENEETGNDKSVSDIGDLSFGFQFQPIRVGGKKPALTISANLSVPTGRSPYEINTDTDISTGNGFYSVSAGISLSKSIDPLIAFGSLNYTRNLSEDGLSKNFPTHQIQVLNKVDPGDMIGFSMGFATALSYNVSLNMSFQYAYRMESSYYFENAPVMETGTSVSTMFSVGTGWRYSPKRTINSRISIGLTEDDPDVTVSFIIPVEFKLK